MHSKIKDYHLTGQISGGNIVEVKERLIKEVEDDMREDGYVPVYDLDPQFSRSYNALEEAFDFHLTLYGVYVGEDRAWQIACLMHGREIPRYTPRTK